MAGKPGRPRKLAPIANHSYDHDKRAMVGRADAWVNWSTGLGDASYDKTVTSYYQKDVRVDDDQLSGLYYGNDLAKLIVDSYVDEAFRCGYELNLPDDDNNEQKDLLDTWKPAIDTACRDLLRWSRLFGGAAIYLDVEDGQALIDPLDVKKVTKINSLRVFDRRYVWPLGYDTDPTSPTYWLPEFYGFGGSLAGSMLSPRVHHSRLLRAVGIEADRRESQYLFWWGHSVLQPVFGVLQRFGHAEQSVILMMQDATQMVFYLRGLADAIANGDAAAIQSRMRMIDMQRSVGRALLLDAGETGGSDAEKSEKLTTPFTGIPDTLHFFMSRVAAAAKVPVSILFGTGFSGLNNSGEGELRAWHAGIQAFQAREVEPILRRLYALVGQVSGIDTSKLKFNWRQLYEPTAAEQADIYLKTAQADQIYMQEGAIRPEEIAISRWGSGKYSTDTTIDVVLYKSALLAAPAPSMQPAAPAPGQPGQAPVDKPAPPGSGAPAPGIAGVASTQPPEKPDVNAAKPDGSATNTKSENESPLAPGEVGGSNKMTTPEITDVTGRGTPVKDREPNKLPPDTSGVKPDDTPVQASKPASKDPSPNTDVQPNDPDEISVQHGNTKIKIKTKKRADALKGGSKEASESAAHAWSMTEKAKKEGTPEAHQAAAQAHRFAAVLYGKQVQKNYMIKDPSKYKDPEGRKELVAEGNRKRDTHNEMAQAHETAASGGGWNEDDHPRDENGRFE